MTTGRKRTWKGRRKRAWEATPHPEISGVLCIPLVGRQGVIRAVALIDAADLPLIADQSWGITSRGYARNSMCQYLHRLLLDAQKGQYVDHINGDVLNNCRNNLRLATATENARNTRVKRGRFKGVYWAATQQRWNAQITANRQVFTVGSFLTEEEAARAYDLKAKELHGEFARLNFPEEQ